MQLARFIPASREENIVESFQIISVNEQKDTNRQSLRQSSDAKKKEKKGKFGALFANKQVLVQNIIAQPGLDATFPINTQLIHL